MTYLHTSTLAPDHLHGGSPRPNPASAWRRLKRNVRVGNRQTTIVLEAYVWDCIDSMLSRENVTLDAFYIMVEIARRHSSMASSARLFVLAYFRLLEQLKTPPFVYSEIVSKQRGGMLQSPPTIAAAVPVLQLALRRFSQDEAHAQ